MSHEFGSWATVRVSRDSWLGGGGGGDVNNRIFLGWMVLVVCFIGLYVCVVSWLGDLVDGCFVGRLGMVMVMVCCVHVRGMRMG